MNNTSEVKPLITIVVPLFNREKTIQKCINSILEQTYKNIELILVDDGSTDRSLEICYSFSKKDNRVLVIHQKNLGPGAARNAGIDAAKGDYIGFVDSDDWVDPKTYEKMINIMKNYDADIVCCNILSYYANGSTDLREKNFKGIKVFDTNESLRQIITHEYFANNVVTKLCKKEIFNEVRFKIGMIYEDAEVMPRIVGASKKLVYTSEPLYYHFNSEVSILRSDFSAKRFDLEKAYKSRLEYYIKNSPENLELAKKQYLEKSLLVLSMSVKNEKYRKEREKLSKKIIDFCDKNKSTKFTMRCRIRCLFLKRGLRVYDFFETCFRKQ